VEGVFSVSTGRNKKIGIKKLRNGFTNTFTLTLGSLNVGGLNVRK
jgi:hypothetical protein